MKNSSIDDVKLIKLPVFKDLKGDNKITYQKYKKYNKEKDPNITFIGRCGLYVYLDMHQAISSSLAISKKFLKNMN